MAGALLWPGLWEENASGQTRIFYLHNLLLLWVSTALLGAIEIAFPGIQPRTLRWVNAVWVTGVAGMIATLFGLALAPRINMPQLPWLHDVALASLLVAAAATAIGGLAIARQQVGAEEVTPYTLSAAPRPVR